MKVDSLEVVIQSDASRANAELDRMIAKLNQVSGALTRTSSTRLGSGNMRGMSNGLSSFIGLSGKARKSTFSLAAAFGKFYASCFLFIRGIKALGKSIGSTMDYIETYNYYNVIMDKIGTEFSDAWKENGYDSADAYAKSFKERLNTVTQKMTGYKIGDEGGLYSTDQLGLGLDPEKMMNYQASIASITNAVGLMGETSINTAKAMSMLAADMSSLKNVDLETVMTNLQSGLIGQSRALYKYGIDITNATLQTYALKYGIEKEVSEMTQAEKMQLRMLAILDQSKVAYGDMANTINGVANQYRVLKQQVANLARTIGALFIPILQAVLPYINGFVVALRRMFEWLGMAVYGANSWSKLMDGISSGYTDNGLDALSDEADDTTDALKDADKAANKLKRTIHGYDELHIATDNSGKDDAKLGQIDLSDEIGNALGAYQSIWDNALKGMDNKAQEIADKIIGYFKKIKDAWNKDADMSFLGEDLGNALNNMLYAIDWEQIKEIGYKLGKSISTAISGFLRTTDWKEVGTAIAEAWNTIIEFWQGIIENFDYKALGLAVANTINGFFSTFDFKSLASAMNTFVDGLTTAISTAFKNINWKDVFKGIGEFFKELDVDTVTFILGAMTLKYMGRVLTSAIFKQVLLNKLLGGLGTLGVSSLGSAAAATFAIGATIYVSFKFAEDAQEWLENVKTYGFDTGREKTASDNKANPYRNGVAYTQDDNSGAFDKWYQDLKEWQENNQKTRDTEKQEFGTWCDNLKSTMSTKWGEVVSWWESSALVKWWTNDVSPWFTAETWNTLYDTIKTTLMTKWTEIVTWWQSSTLVTWFEEDVKPWFTPKTWAGLYATVKDSLVAKWEEVVAWWKTTGAYKWYEDNVKPLFEEKKWSFAGIKDGLKKAFDVAVDAVKSVWNSFANWLNEKLTFTIPETEIFGNKVGGATFSLGKLPKFATGGFPEDGLFMANHNELVGKFNNGKTAVVNNEQIISGISSGVADGLMSVLMAQGSSDKNTESETHIHIHFGSDEIGVATYRGLKEASSRGLIPKIV